jgi:predicted site-specific integrase-resolvase
MGKQPTAVPYEGATSQRPMLNLRDMCHVLRVSRPFLLRAIADGLIEASVINGRGEYRFHPDEPARFMERTAVKRAS